MTLALQAYAGVVFAIRRESGDAHDPVLSNSMASAATRVLSLPELLEHILLSLPERKYGLPEFQYFVLQRVNRGFKETITGSSKIMRRMFLEELGQRQFKVQYRFLEWLSERGVLPLMVRSKPTLTHPTSLNFVVVPEIFYLHTPSRHKTDFMPDHNIGYTMIRAHESRAHSVKPCFRYEHASWRQLTVHPSAEVCVFWRTTLVDEKGRLHGGYKRSQLEYCFHFNALNSGTLGNLFDMIEKIKSRSVQERIFRQTQAMEKLLKLKLNRHEQLEKLDWPVSPRRKMRASLQTIARS